MSESNLISFPARRLEKIESVNWKTHETAVVVCDMWDRTICKSAERRVVELAPLINEFIISMRSRGVLIIHAPSSVTNFYENSPQRKLAKEAAFVKAYVPINWNDPEEFEGVYPVDDSDWCDDSLKCPVAEIEASGKYPWTRQIASIEIMPEDAISDDGQEIYNLMESRGVKNVFEVGVHLNRCVLGRPFGIRQMVKFGKEVVLIRDLVDGLYDPRQFPFVSHEEGVGLLVRHVEKYWCPSVESTEII